MGGALAERATQNEQTMEQPQARTMNRRDKLANHTRGRAIPQIGAPMKGHGVEHLLLSPGRDKEIAGPGGNGEGGQP